MSYRNKTNWYLPDSTLQYLVHKMYLFMNLKLNINSENKAYDHMHYSSHILRLRVNTEMNRVGCEKRKGFKITGLLVELLTHTV